MRNKILYGTTALVSAGVLMANTANAQGIKLGLSGYNNNFFGFGNVESDEPDTDFSSTGLFSDGEVHFVGEAVLDVAITVGVQVELELFNVRDKERGDIDDAYAYIDGAFGRVQLGAHNTAAYLMQFSAPNVGVPINSGWVTPFVPPPENHAADGPLVFGEGYRRPTLSTFVDWGDSDNTVTYFTPRVQGFQLGTSFQPTVTDDRDDRRLRAIVDRSGTLGPIAPNDQDFFDERFGIAEETARQGTNGISFGTNYIRSFQGVDLALSGGYRTILDEDPNLFGSRPEQWSAGVNVGYAGFTLGGSWALENSELPNGEDHPHDGHSFDVGASYRIGPWAVGLTYFQSAVTGLSAFQADEEDTVETPGDDKVKSLEAGLEYSIGPGITTSFSVLYAEQERGDGVKNDGTLGIVGLSLTF